MSGLVRSADHRPGRALLLWLAGPTSGSTDRVANDADSPTPGVVAIGGSAGGVEALCSVAGGLPGDFPFAVLMALHLPAHGPSVLAEIVNRSGPLPAVTAEQGTRLEAGRIYVAVPGRHLLTRDHRVMLSDGPTESGHRPAINALFRSVASAFGPRAVGVLLSGVLDDGVHGLAAIRSRGGVTVCQHPDDAAFPAMPLNALQAGVVDRVATAAEMGPLLVEITGRQIPDDTRTLSDPYLDAENRIAMAHRFSMGPDTESLGPPSGFTCPDCHGSLHTLDTGHYRCQVGHAWATDALLAARDREIENALWVAVRSLHEKSRLAHQLAERATSPSLRHRYSALASETDKALTVLRERLVEAETESRPDDG